MRDNDVCDDECNVEECNYDNGSCYTECSPGCTFELYYNDTCDELCNFDDCVIDTGICLT